MPVFGSLATSVDKTAKLTVKIVKKPKLGDLSFADDDPLSFKYTPYLNNPEKTSSPLSSRTRRATFPTRPGDDQH
jgi:hypothetical protein